MAMNESRLTRRRFVQNSLAMGGPALIATSSLALAASQAESPASISQKLKVVCAGAHPDDPESGCAGTLARYVAMGHVVTVIYLTRGERGIPGKSNEEAAQIRTREAEAACKVIGAKAVFAGQIDGSTEFTRSRVDELARIFSDEKPDLVFAHWPIDTHMDHQAASMCTLRACMAMPRWPRVYFFEVNTGSQALGFTPNHYVDITAVVDKKKAALYAHASQDGEGIWKKHHEIVAGFRGREAGVGAAESFYHLNRDSQFSPLPGI